MLGESQNAASHFLYSYYATSSNENLINQFEDDFVNHFTEIHAKTQNEVDEISKISEDLTHLTLLKQECVSCQNAFACVASKRCGHVLYCKKCFKEVISYLADINNRPYCCPICDYLAKEGKERFDNQKNLEQSDFIEVHYED